VRGIELEAEEEQKEKKVEEDPTVHDWNEPSRMVGQGVRADAQLEK